MGANTKVYLCFCSVLYRWLLSDNGTNNGVKNVCFGIRHQVVFLLLGVHSGLSSSPPMQLFPSGAKQSPHAIDASFFTAVKAFQSVNQTK